MAKRSKGPGYGHYSPDARLILANKIDDVVNQINAYEASPSNGIVFEEIKAAASALGELAGSIRDQKLQNLLQSATSEISNFKHSSDYKFMYRIQAELSTVKDLLFCHTNITDEKLTLMQDTETLFNIAQRNSVGWHSPNPNVERSMLLDAAKDLKAHEHQLQGHPSLASAIDDTYTWVVGNFSTATPHQYKGLCQGLINQGVISRLANQVISLNE